MSGTPRAVPSAPGELVFTDEQLTLLARLAGLAAFPAAGPRELYDAGWAAVLDGLLARGAVHDDDPSSDVRLVDAVLGVVMDADRWLWITITDREDATRSRAEILWLKGEPRVRQMVNRNGFHWFSTATIEELLADALDFGEGRDPSPGAPHKRAGDELAALLADARGSASVECSRRVGDDRIEGAALTFVTSLAGDLWLLDGEDEGQVFAQAIGAEAAHARVAALAATLAQDAMPPVHT